MPGKDDKSRSTLSDIADDAQIDERTQARPGAIALPAHVAGSGALDRLVETARDYARAAASDNTLRAYAKDWAHFARWCRMRGTDPLPPSPELIGLYLADLAAPADGTRPLTVATIERRLSGLVWATAQRGLRLDRGDRHIATVLAGIRRKHARPPVQKEAIMADDIRAMVATLPHDLRGLRDRSILLIGFAGGLRRSEIVSLDHGKDDTPDSGGWVEIMDQGALITLRGKTGWREVEIGRGSSLRAYATDWAYFARWCRMRGADPLPPSPELIGLYLADLAAPGAGTRPLTVATIERRLSGLVWAYGQRGLRLDRGDPHIASVLAGIRRRHARPPVQKEAILAQDILAMAGTLPFDLRGLRDRAILLLGYAGGLRRSEIVGLDAGRDDTPDSRGWIEIVEDGALLTLDAKTGWRVVEVGRGSSPRTCPVHAVEQWLHFAKISFGPVFTRMSRDDTRALGDRLNDRHVARLIKRTVLAAGLRPDLPEAERLALYSGHSLRAGLASSAEVNERHVQKHLGHASAEMTRRYQRRRDRFRVNLTKAAGL